MNNKNGTIAIHGSVLAATDVRIRVASRPKVCGIPELENVISSRRATDQLQSHFLIDHRV